MQDPASTPEALRTRSATPLVPLAIAVGGAIGAIARYGMAVWLPAADGSFPWATFWTNVAGCLAIGLLMALLTEVVQSPHHLWRHFLGVGVLGGFTTFSTFAVDVQQLLLGDAAGVAMAYVFGTLAAGLIAVEVGRRTTRLMSGRA